MDNIQFKLIGINLDDVIELNKNRFNSNNHWENNIKPDDYNYTLSLTNTNNWIDKFRDNYYTFTINNKNHLYWMKQAFEVGKLTGQFSKLYVEELEDTVKELDKLYGHLFDGTGYFVRTENVSLKYGVNKTGPYYNIKTILESLVTSTNGHSPIYHDTNSINIYLIPWVNIDPKYEFRIFVFNNQITGISQQNLYSKLLNDDDIQKEKIIPKLKSINEFFNSDIKNKVNWINNYSIDFALIDGVKPYVIELNSFGQEYAAGSALFHWIIDHDILYNDFQTNKNIEFRYIN